MSSTALLIVDIQVDFFPGGNLPISTSEEIIQVANDLMVKFFDKGFPVFGTQCWYPRYHKKFAKNHRAKNYTMGEINGDRHLLWPEHCVENSLGAQLHPDLLDIPTVVFKGMDSECVDYSGFSTTEKNAGLFDLLKSDSVDEIFIIGMMTDFSVKHTAIDAATLGFDVTVMLEGCRGLDMPKGNVHKSLTEMLAAGIKLV